MGLRLPVRGFLQAYGSKGYLGLLPKGYIRACMLGILAAQAFVLVLHSAPVVAAPGGITGSFRLTYARLPTGSSQPSFEVKMDGKFWSSGNNFAAETAYPIPGGGSEKVRILLLEDCSKLLLLYPETMNYRRIQLSYEKEALLKTVSSAVGSSFTATPEMLTKSGIILNPLGKQAINGESLLAYRVHLPDGKKPAVTSVSRQEWNLLLYFTPKGRRIRLMRAFAPGTEFRLLINDVKQSQMADDKFKVPSGYYQLKPEEGFNGLR